MFPFYALDHCCYLKQEALPSLGQETLLPAGVNCEFVILNLGSLLLQVWI